MKKLTKSVLAVVLSASFSVSYAQKAKVDTAGTKDIKGVVVTALGIKREKKSLGYATQEVKGEDISKNPTTNFLNNLSGQVAGLDIKQGTNFGGSVNVVLRGFKSLKGSNQALFVIDGVPVINSNVNSSDQANGRYGYDYGNAVSDLNPNDIADINVLKGAAATALYGWRAQNGAIIITTKKGKSKKGVGVEFGSSVTISTIDKSTFAEYQDQYGQGYLGQTFGSYLGSPRVSFGHDASYGPKYEGQEIWQYDAFIPGSPTFGQKTRWEVAKNGPATFFEKGTNFVNSVSFGGGDNQSNFRLSYSNTNATDILPNSSLIKNNFGGNATYKITDKLSGSIYANIITQKTKGRNTTGYGDNLMSNFRQWWGTNIDLNEQKNLYNLSNQNYTWNIRSVTNITPQYWDNPYFQRYQNFQNDSRDRFVGNFSLTYDVSKSINLMARIGTDSYNLFTEERRAVGSVPALFGLNNSVDQPSGYSVANYKFRETNYDFIATLKKNITEDVNLNAVLGANLFVQSQYSNQQSTSGGLLIPKLYTISNSSSTPLNPVITDVSKQILGLFSQVSLGYKNTYYIEGSIRRDYSSALPKENREYWYPSVSTSIVLSNLVKADWFTFGKLRAAYTIVGSDTAPNQIKNQYYTDTPFTTPMYYYNTSQKNPNIKSQSLKSTELGLNMQFFKNRFGFDIGWFNNDAYDQILGVPVSYGSGAVTEVKNAGNLRTRGFEVALNLTPVKTNDFSWDVNVNWSNPNTKVTELADGVDNLQLGSLQGGVSINAPKGYDYGTIWGSDFVYSPTGEKVVGENGAYLISSTSDNNLGSYQAKWFGGLRNTFNYKNLSFSFLVDWKKGGKVFSLDQYYGYGTGLYPDSVGTNDLGNPIRNTIANGGGVILNGVMVDPNNPNNYIQNTIRLDKSMSSQVLETDPPAAAFVYDASYVKLREVSISYKLPNNLFNNTFIQGITVGAVGNNLWIMHKNLPYADPEAGLSSGNVQGYQSGPMPTTRNISFNVKVNF